MKFLNLVKHALTNKRTPHPTSVKATPEMLAAGIIYAAGAHVKGIEVNLRQFQEAAAEIFPLPDLESEAGFRVLEESINLLWALTRTRVLQVYQPGPIADACDSRLVLELAKLALGCRISVTTEKLAEAWLLYFRPTKEEILQDYADYIFAEDCEEIDDAALVPAVFHARTLRALGVKVSVSPLLCTGLLAVDSTFLTEFWRLLGKTELDMG